MLKISYYNNNNNNNNNNKLQLGYHVVAVVILHVHKYILKKKTATRKFKSGGLHEKHVVACREVGRLESTCLPARDTSYTHTHNMLPHHQNII